ncbi:MEDS domain-containing protein [Clostridium sp. UBA4548]|uniref:MEDS domain-containing protein n=1 Tax=Clostridium sp. UBA4548 TaxID=1946361 RepID=UPI0025BC4BF4|nr:MEDS domain-containing protein [Clostridium sp. UBA4548]
MNTGLGKHISFYYYGEDHMVINLYKFIKDSIINNNFVFLYIEDDVYQLVLDSLTDTEKYMVGKIDLEKIIMNNNKNTNEFICKCLNNYKSQKLEQGFINTKFIFDAKKIIHGTSINLFKAFANYCFDAVERERIDILTLYDFGEYMLKGKYINDEVIKVSYLEHTHRMFANDILPIKEFENQRCLA